MAKGVKVDDLWVAIQATGAARAATEEAAVEKARRAWSVAVVAETDEDAVQAAAEKARRDWRAAMAKAMGKLNS